MTWWDHSAITLGVGDQDFSSKRRTRTDYSRILRTHITRYNHGMIGHEVLYSTLSYRGL